MVDAPEKSAQIQRPLVPYGEVLPALAASIRFALGEFLTVADSKGIDALKVTDVSINRHFVWLTQFYSEGTNQHLFDSGDTRNLPLRTLALRRAIPTDIESYLIEGRSLPIGKEAAALGIETGPFIRKGPTRISQLIRTSVTSAQKVRTLTRRVIVPSFLGIAYRYLTHPELPGTQAYAQAAIRNYLFDWMKLFPANALSEGPATIDPIEVERAYSTFWTYMRPRFESKGADAPDVSAESTADNLVKHFLAARGLFHYRFQDLDSALFHCSSPHLIFPNTELVRAAEMARLPDRGEIVNELFGIPIPIRGADTIFRGGLRLSARKGLVVAVHGGPGSGKTSLALALGASLAPFGTRTLYFTAEEIEPDLIARVDGVIPDAAQRLSFASETFDWLTVRRIETYGKAASEIVRELQEDLEFIASVLNEDQTEAVGAPTSRAVVVLDGLQDIFGRAGNSDSQEGRQTAELHEFLERCRELKALVILTTGENWSGDSKIDYLVDTALKLSHTATDKIDAKPHREITLSKARHQFCAPGAHGFQLSGNKGVRFSPQINYQLERRSIWRTSLHDETMAKNLLRRVMRPVDDETIDVQSEGEGVYLFSNANIFINGQGSGGKAALALKIAIAPTFRIHRTGVLASPRLRAGAVIPIAEKILLLSFLYPEDYYQKIIRKLTSLRSKEYSELKLRRPKLHVEHLFPGYLRPVDLFNRIEWTLQAAELQGEPFTTVIIDGIHNVFIQFPELEEHQLIWPQLLSLLRSRDLSIISTHTTLVVPRGSSQGDLKIDDDRSEPLRHALVQKTDFQFELKPRRADSSMSDWRFFDLTTLSAIGQAVPRHPTILWDRERMILVTPGSTQGLLI